MNAGRRPSQAYEPLDVRVTAAKSQAHSHRWPVHARVHPRVHNAANRHNMPQRGALPTAIKIDAVEVVKLSVLTG